MDKNVQELQDEMKVLKNEIKETLTDIREYLLSNVDNPFPTEAARRDLPRQGNQGPPASPVYNGVPAYNVPPVVGRPQGDIYGGQGFTGPAQADSGVRLVHHIGQAPSVSPGASVAPAVNASKDKDTEMAESQEPVSEGEPVARERETRKAAPKAAAFKSAKVEPLASPGKAKPKAMDSSSNTASKTEGGSEPMMEGELQAAEPTEALDLGTLAMLAPWVEHSIHKIGSQRLLVIMDVYASMGGLSEQLKGVLFQLISLDGNARPVNKVPLRECLRVLVELDSLLWRSRSDPRGATLLSILLNGKESAVVSASRKKTRRGVSSRSSKQVTPRGQDASKPHDDVAGPGELAFTAGGNGSSQE